MHTFEAAYEIHNRESFHPWHRAYLMHLERELQNVDARVTVPYWKFDKEAPNVFTPEFVGKTAKSFDPDLGIGEVLRPEFHPNNPLNFYKENTVWGPLRRAYWHTNPAEGKPNPSIHDESIVLNYSDEFQEWCGFEERRSHNPAHNSFRGHVVDIGKDPVDPLFFMMHANVDRLWAKWQEKYDRFDRKDEKTYPLQHTYQGSRGDEWADENPGKFLRNDGYFRVDSSDLGNFEGDTLWPWDKDKSLSRPWRKWYRNDYGCGNVPYLEIDFPTSATSNFPKGALTVGSTIDYQGRIDNETVLGFDYEDIPYFERDKVPSDTVAVNTVDFNETFLNANAPEAERLEAANFALFHAREDVEKV